MWQKARFRKEDPFFSNKELWVKTQAPIPQSTDSFFRADVTMKKTQMQTMHGYPSHLYEPVTQRTIIVSASYIELLGGPEAFAEEVPLQSIKDWIKLSC